MCDQRKIPLFAGDIDSVARRCAGLAGLFSGGLLGGAQGRAGAQGHFTGRCALGAGGKVQPVINLRAARAQGVTLAPRPVGQSRQSHPVSFLSFFDFTLAGLHAIFRQYPFGSGLLLVKLFWVASTPTSRPTSCTTSPCAFSWGWNACSGSTRA